MQTLKDDTIKNLIDFNKLLKNNYSTIKNGLLTGKENQKHKINQYADEIRSVEIDMARLN